jgi:hypothetical protein
MNGVKIEMKSDEDETLLSRCLFVRHYSCGVFYIQSGVPRLSRQAYSADVLWYAYQPTEYALAAGAVWKLAHVGEYDDLVSSGGCGTGAV